jgi:Family of unknown function (DUF5340)
MEPIPLPSPVHYELLLQLLERQTLPSVRPPYQEPVHQLIITLRKAVAQHKQLQETLENAGISVESRWSLNSPTPPSQLPLADPLTDHL